ncbi:MAG: DUF4012 domain-containing protein, partial [Nocardioides sp.]
VSLAWSAFTLWQVYHELSQARRAAIALRAGIYDDDKAARNEAAYDLADAASAAADHTGGVWWRLMTWTPVVGDDLAGVGAVSQSMDAVANDGMRPLLSSLDQLDHVTVDRRVDLGLVARLRDPIEQARQAFVEAEQGLADEKSSGYLGPLQTRYDEYAALIAETRRALASADKALDVLPELVGAHGPRDYLLVFQNNAEIRATAGLPGSWALVHAEDGLLTMEEQDGGGFFPETAKPVLPLTPGEAQVYGPQLGTYFRDANFTPDFPRAAALMDAQWARSFPGVPLDGVISIDVRALSYLLQGVGPVEVEAVAGAVLTKDNVVDALLKVAYERFAPDQQNDVFEAAAKAIFEASKGDIESPLKLVRGLDRATTEGRFRISLLDGPDADLLDGTRVRGVLAGDDGSTPHVDIGLNDATGAKMSYYLSYTIELDAAECTDGVQTLQGSVRLGQSISGADAKALPDYVTGAARYGIPVGQQLVLVRLYAPYGGRISDVEVDGQAIDQDVLQVVELGGRPVVTLTAQLADPEGTELSWRMRTGPGQTGDTELRVTPSILPGTSDATVASAC